MKQHRCFDKAFTVRAFLATAVITICMTSHLWAGEKPKVDFGDNMPFGECQEIKVLNQREGTSYSCEITSGGGSLNGCTFCAPTSCDEGKTEITITGDDGMQETITIGFHSEDYAEQLYVREAMDCAQDYCPEDYETACCWDLVDYDCSGNIANGPHWLWYRCLDPDIADIWPDQYWADIQCQDASEQYAQLFPAYFQAAYTNQCCPETGGGGGGGTSSGSPPGDGSSPSGPSTDSNGSPPPSAPPGEGGSGPSPPGGDNGDDETCPPELVSNPVDILDGSKKERQQDLSLAGPTTALTVTRYYNSLFGDDARMGHGWNHTYAAVLTTDTGLAYDLKIKDIDGRGLYFKKTSPTIYEGLYAELTTVEFDEAGYSWKRKSGSTYHFDIDGRLIWIDDASGNRKSLSYDGQGRLYSVTDQQSDRMITFDYDAGNRICQVNGPATQAVPDGIWVRYQYDGNGNLSDVIYPDDTGFQYLYTDTRFAHHLTAKKDRSGRTLASWTFDDQGRAISSQTIDGDDLIIEYGQGLEDNIVTVTDGQGVVKRYTLTRVDGIKRVLEVSNTNACSSCGNSVNRYSYDDQYRIIQKVFTNGRVDQYFDFNANGRPGRVVRAFGSLDERTIYYTYHPSINQLLRRKESSVLGFGDKETIWDYDNDGNDTPNEAPSEHLYRYIERGYTLDASGQVVAYEYVTAYEYNSKGQITAVDGPLPGDQDKVVYTYDPTTGDLSAVTTPLVGDTLYGHDDAGNLTSSTDVNGVVTAFTYDGRNRLLTTTRNGITFSRTYTDTGELDTTTDPIGRIMDYDYTQQGFLEKVTDPAGNYAFNVYDTQGRRVEASIFAADGTHTHYRGYDYGDLLTNPDLSPGKPWKVYHRNHDDTDYLETVYSYDSAGQLSTVTDANGNMTGYGYDLFNRLVQVQQPGYTTTSYSYDQHGNLSSITDAEGHVTAYFYDDLGRLVETVSPDTGTTRYIYNEAGQLADKIQNGKGTGYLYDAIGRLVRIAYNDPGQDVVYTYDSGAGDFLIGRPASMTDPSGTYEYSYDALGRLVSQSRTMDGTTFTTAYGYDDAGNLRTIAYPTGQVIEYQPDPVDPARVSSVILNPGGSNQTLASGLTYQPFGPPTAMTFGNGIGLVQTYDKNYRIGTLSVTGILDRTYSPDSVGNILSIDDNLDPARSQSFGYDDLYRLTSAGGIYGNIGYSYDKVGNRLTRTDSQGTDTYGYLYGTNKLRTVAGPNAKTYSYDNDGNTIAALGGQQPPLADQADYTYNSNGQRIVKTADSQATVQHFDQSGRLIAETDATGNMLKAYIWLNGQPLAMIAADGALYYFHNDHLGTPQKMTDATGAVAWAADYLPFGQADVTMATVENNLRFAGQYYDSETGLHYNYHRYYDPSLGRYLRADPIGLAAGVNLYVYVQNNPVNWIDPFGLEYSRWNTTPYDTDYGGGSGGFAPPPATPEQIFRDPRDFDDGYPDPVLAEIPVGPGGSVGKTARKINAKRAGKWKKEIEKLIEKLKKACTKAEKKEIKRQLKHARTQLRKSEPHARKGQGYNLLII